MATERLLETMLELKKQGVAQIIISHRLQDIFAVGDRVMVLKRGENVGDRYIQHTTEQEVLQIIVTGTPEPHRPPMRPLPSGLVNPASRGRACARPRFISVSYTCCCGTTFRIGICSCGVVVGGTFAGGVSGGRRRLSIRRRLLFSLSAGVASTVPAGPAG